MAQIALPLDTRETTGPVRIVVGDANRAAIEAIREPSRWPYRTAVLVGPPRCGKSLCASWFAAAGMGEAIDDADRHDEAALFHAWNRVQENGRSLLLTASPGWRISLPDLASRLGGSLQLSIGAPGDEQIADLLASHAEQRRLALGEGAGGYLVPRIERSWAAVETLVEQIDRISLERQTAATISVWRDALEAVQGPEQGRLL